MPAIPEEGGGVMKSLPWITPSGHDAIMHINLAKEYRYNLVEMSHNSHRGEILRAELMTEIEADRRNAAMSGTVIEWQKNIEQEAGQ